ncbi:MAG: hypothetical protein U1E62_06995 [Alsobacter sp.]
MSAEACYRAFRAHYTKAQYHWVQFTTEWLSDCSRAFDGDLQMMLILAVVGQPHLASANAPQETGTEAPQRSINASRIADVTGIPRETIRRKLDAMAKRGWVQQHPDASWSIAVVDNETPARLDLRELEDAAIRKVSRFVANFVPLVRQT